MIRRPYAVTLAFLAVALALLPVALASVPGFTDMPSHMARHHVMAAIGSSPDLGRHFTVSWHWIANLGVDLPAVLLAKWIGAEASTRLVAALIAPLAVAGILALSRAAHGRVVASAFLAMPLTLHQAYMWGFLNYCLGVGLALLLAAWIIARPERTPLAQMALGCGALAVWTAHMVSWGILLVIAAGAELAGLRRIRDLKPAIMRNLPLLAPLVPLVLWRAQSTGFGLTLSYGDFLHTKAIVFASVFRGTDKIVDLLLLGVLVAASLLAVIWAGARRFEPRLFLAGLLLTACALLAPITLLDAWGTDLRIAPIALLLLVASITPPAKPERERVLLAIGFTLYVVRLGTITYDWTRRSEQLELRLAMLDSIPRGSRLGFLYMPPQCGYPWQLTPDDKLGSYAVVRRDAFANTLFKVENAQLVSPRDTDLAQRWTDGSQRLAPICPVHRADRALLKRRLEQLRDDGFDTIWIAGVSPDDVPELSGWAVVRARARDSLLRRLPPGP